VRVSETAADGDYYRTQQTEESNAATDESRLDYRTHGRKATGQRTTQQCYFDAQASTG
jgi:hypothetical protein